MKVTVNSGLIQKRVSSLQSNYSAPDSKIYYERAKISDEENRPNRNKNIIAFVEHCNDFKNANKYFRQCLHFLNRAYVLEDTSLVDAVLSNFQSRVLPYIEDVNQVRNIVKRYDLPCENMLMESIEQIDTVDRIVSNHDQISKRFDIESLFRRGTVRTINLEKTILRCCNLMDTYDTDAPKKMALTLEEVFYQIDKNKVPCNRSKVVQEITEYFLHREPKISTRDYNGYRRVLELCPVISDQDTSKVNYFTTPCANPASNNITQIIDLFKSNPNKSPEYLKETLENLFVKCRPRDIADAMQDLMYYFRMQLVRGSSIFSMEDISILVSTIIQGIINTLSENPGYDNFTREDIQICKDAFTEQIRAIDIDCYDMDDLPEESDRLFDFKRIMQNAIKQLDDILSYVNTSYNESVICTINKETAEMKPIPLEEFKLFKFDNLLNACRRIDKKLQEKGTKGLKKVIDKAKSIKNKIFENCDLYELIDNETHRFDSCISKMEFDESCNIEDIHNAASDFCKAINNDDFLMEGAHCYYRITNCLEFHLEYAPELILTKEEVNTIEENVAVDDWCYYQSLYELSNQIRILNSIDIKGLLEKAESYNLSEKQLILFAEAARYTNGMITESDIDCILSSQIVALRETGKLNLTSYSTIGSIQRKWVEEKNVPESIMIESLQLISSILEADDKDNKEESKNKENNDSAKDEKSEKTEDKGEENKEVSDKKEKNPFAGVNLNNLQLYVNGLRGKMKDMSNKEKELSRNVDTAVTRLSKAVKDALISDRREAIIKGSVIPSFSKSIKLAIGAAGIYLINPAAAVITVIGGLAMSKKLTKQERLLLLDELETEMEVCDKEIQIAESKNQMKRYRKLLGMKKDMQRQYQRIKYNIRVGKDILPGSTTGLKSQD